MVTVKELEETMVEIRDLCKDQSVVFPPINHENLHEHSSTCLSPLSSLGLASSPSNSSISSTSSFSPSDIDDLSYPVRDQVRTREPRQVSWWWRIGLGVLQSRVVLSASAFGCKIASRVAFWSMFPAAVGAFWVVYLQFQLSRRFRRRHREDRLLLILKEQDKKIAELLSQVAQMKNLLMSSRQKV